MLLTHTVVDLGDFTHNIFTAMALVVSVVALFTTDSRADEANRTALDANATAREAREIAERSLDVAKRTDMRELLIALESPVDTVCGEIRGLVWRGPDTDNSTLSTELGYIGKSIGHVHGLVPRGTELSRYLNECRDFLARAGATLEVASKRIPGTVDEFDRNTLVLRHNAGQSLIFCMENISQAIAATRVDYPDDSVWIDRSNSLGQLISKCRSDYVAFFDKFASSWGSPIKDHEMF